MRVYFARLEATITNMSGKTLEKEISPKHFYIDPWIAPSKRAPVSKEDQIQDIRNNMGLLRMAQDPKNR